MWLCSCFYGRSKLLPFKQIQDPMAAMVDHSKGQSRYKQTQLDFQLPSRGSKKRHNGPSCPEQNDHVSQRPRRDYQDDKETPDSGSPKLDAEIVIGGAAEVKPLKR